MALTGGDQDVALASGSVDAIYGGGLDLVDRGVARIIDSIQDDNYPTVAWNASSTYTTQKFIDKYPDIVYRWVKVYLKIADEIERNDNKPLLRRLDTKSGTSLKNVIAAEPDAKPSAPVPPSSAAMRCSKTSVVGFMMRV